MLKNLNIGAFEKPIKYFLSNNLTKSTRSTLANMLAMDYLRRLENKAIIEEHADNCVTRLKNHLKSKVILDTSFSIAFNLFTIAISPDETNIRDKTNILNQNKGQNAAAEALLDTYFSEYSGHEQAQIKGTLKNLLQHSNANEILNYFNVDHAFLEKIVTSSSKSIGVKHEIDKKNLLEINKVIKRKMVLDNKTDSFKQKTASIITAFSSMAIVATSVLLGGMTLPLLVVPAAIFSLKIAPRMGENLAKTILNLDSTIEREKNSINKVKAEVINNVTKILLINQVKNKEPIVNHDIFQSKSEELEQIKKQLKSNSIENLTVRTVETTKKNKVKNEKGV